MKGAFAEYGELIIGAVATIGFIGICLQVVFPGGILNNFITQFINSIC